MIWNFQQKFSSDKVENSNLNALNNSNNEILATKAGEYEGSFTKGKAPTTAVGSESGLALRERIIIFYSDRNINEAIKFRWLLLIF